MEIYKWLKLAPVVSRGNPNNLDNVDNSITPKTRSIRSLTQGVKHEYN